MGRVCVVGLGRVGLPTAALAAAAGHVVVGVDRDPAARERARHPAAIGEPGLAELLARAPITVVERVEPADCYVVCVGRPADSGRSGLSTDDLDRAVAEVAGVAPPGATCLIEATVPVGTTDRLAERFPAMQLAVAPERVLPGNAVREIRDNPRVVGGAAAVAKAAAAWLSTWCEGEISVVDARTAELAKLVENTARDVEVALANTVGAVARRHGVDPSLLRRLVNQHPRVHLLEPGIGVGGPCLPVDPWLLGDPAEPLIAAARAVNDAVPSLAAARIDREPGTIGVLGLTYKAGVDDTRRAPAVEVVRALGHRDVVAHDPHVVDPIDGVVQAPLSTVLARDLVVRLVAHRAFEGWEALVAPRSRTLDLSGGWA